MNHEDEAIRREVLKDILFREVGQLPDLETPGPYLWWCNDLKHIANRIVGYVYAIGLDPLTEDEVWTVQEAIIAAATPLPVPEGIHGDRKSWFETAVARPSLYPSRSVEMGEKVGYDGRDEFVRTHDDVSCFALSMYRVTPEGQRIKLSGPMALDFGVTYDRIRRCIRDGEDIELIQIFTARSGEIYTEVFLHADVGEWMRADEVENMVMFWVNNTLELRVLTSDDVLLIKD